MRVRLGASTLFMFACGCSGIGSPPPDANGGASGCTVAIWGAVVGPNLTCSKRVAPLASGTEQALLTVVATPTQPLLFSLLCIEPSPLVPGTYGLVSATTQLGCTASFDIARPPNAPAASNEGFLPRPSAGATVEATLTSVMPLHGSATGTLIESYYDGGAGRTVTFSATF